MRNKFLLLLFVSTISLSGSNIFEQDDILQTVVIDPGHGGKDGGCSGATTAQEKHVTLAIALKLGEKIKAAYPDVNVVYTRDKDVFVELHKRAEIANEHKANLFISIHCNAAIRNKQRASGSETFALGLHRADDNLEVMKRENDVILLEKDYEINYDYDPHSTENHIINALIQNKYLEQSLNLATKIEREFVLSKRKSRGVKQAGFAVLRGAAMPAVLIESGFLTHNGEEKFLNSKAGQNTMAEAIFKAFKAYKEEQETEAEIVIESTAKGVTTQNSSIKGVNNIQFKIQLAAVSNTENPNLAALLKAGEIKIVEEKGIKKVMSKGFDSYEEAAKSKQKWRETGFPDAFVVVYKNGVRISMADYKKN